ncbi:MAG TPA: DUF1109 domain-containing protein [Caulobacteraceae bacterium]|nr:DUF1109 domain-containing protein [Caulobacteraceae bacterium]
MRTDELITLLSRDAPSQAGRRFAPLLLGAGVVGAAVSLAVLIAWLGMRPMHEAMRSGSFWMKAAYTTLLAASGLFVTTRLARPGGRAGAALWIAALAIAWLATMAGMETMHTPAAGLPRLWLGQTWRVCPFRIVALSLPVLAAALIALRRMAPTQPALAGAMAGLFAGAVGATVYGLYCRETAAAFVVVWYSLGIAACAALGAAIGARALRW